MGWNSNSNSGQRFFLFLRVGQFLSRAIAQKILFWIFIRELQLATFEPLYMLNNAQRPNLTGYPFTYMHTNRQVGSAVAMVIYWCILLLDF